MQKYPGWVWALTAVGWIVLGWVMVANHPKDCPLIGNLRCSWNLPQ